MENLTMHFFPEFFNLLFLPITILEDFNFNTLSNLAKGATDVTSFIRMFARADMTKLSLLISIVVSVTCRPKQTVSGWFSPNQDADIPLRYLPVVIKSMKAVGYPVQIIKDWFLSIFDDFHSRPKSINEIEKETIILLAEMRKEEISDIEDMNERDTLILMGLGSQAGEIRDQCFRKVLEKTGCNTNSINEALKQLQPGELFAREKEIKNA